MLYICAARFDVTENLKIFTKIKKNGIRILVGVDTVFGHVSLGAYLDLMRYRSAGRKVMIDLQKSCR